MARPDTRPDSGVRVLPGSPTLAALRARGKRMYRMAGAVYYLWRNERRARTRPPLVQKLRMWRHGFLADSLELYDFSRNDMRDYVSDYAYHTTCRAFTAYPEFFDHKAVQRAILLAQGFCQPETVAILAYGRARLNPLCAAACSVSV